MKSGGDVGRVSDHSEIAENDRLQPANWGGYTVLARDISENDRLQPANWGGYTGVSNRTLFAAGAPGTHSGAEAESGTEPMSGSQTSANSPVSPSV